MLLHVFDGAVDNFGYLCCISFGLLLRDAWFIASILGSTKELSDNSDTDVFKTVFVQKVGITLIVKRRLIYPASSNRIIRIIPTHHIKRDSSITDSTCEWATGILRQVNWDNTVPAQKSACRSNPD
ncbi:hypothetical protein HacjB3_16651 (plasmid) [Halalkalicoccus jeotgali B3]|uniref:Uncharacterized protein n=1 Tax=Halalkalicoccus jeotgali (strain DSM 18796 / CECT 7217 / JCM 14584 / KCTC 4019 / B3) TaxID=795797 RepID=D8JBM7_HALJB|nr:hypothetical protein HacjB3_16651 [Halalkalicoccus jeotgali B3]